MDDKASRKKREGRLKSVTSEDIGGAEKVVGQIKSLNGVTKAW